MSKLKVFAVLLVITLVSGSLFAQEEEYDPLQGLMDGCAAEIENYCSQVTLGEGRLMACFFAHEDKLSNQCLHSVYDAAEALAEAVNAMIYVAATCGADIDAHCSEIEPAEGRILNCLTASRESISEQCSTTLNDLE